MKWIDSNKALPNRDEIVIFYYDDDYHIGRFSGYANDGRELWQSFQFSYNCVENVKYWSYLEKPEETI